MDNSSGESKKEHQYLPPPREHHQLYINELVKNQYALSDDEAKEYAEWLIKICTRFYDYPLVEVAQKLRKTIPENVHRYFLALTDRLKLFDDIPYDVDQDAIRTKVFLQFCHSRFFAKALLKRKHLLKNLYKHLRFVISVLGREPGKIDMLLEVAKIVCDLTIFASLKERHWKYLFDLGFHNAYLEIWGSDIFGDNCTHRVQKSFGIYCFHFFSRSAFRGVILSDEIMLANADLFLQRAAALCKIVKSAEENDPNTLISIVRNFLMAVAKVPGFNAAVQNNSEFMKIISEVQGGVLLKNVFFEYRVDLSKVSDKIYRFCSFSGCGKYGEKTKLKLCSGCSNTHYCSVACQKKDWKQHKRVCKAFQKGSGN